MGKRFNIIYADPPWQFKTYSKKGSLQKSADCHYSCLDIDEIMKLNGCNGRKPTTCPWILTPLCSPIQKRMATRLVAMINRSGIFGLNMESAVEKSGQKWGGDKVTPA